MVALANVGQKIRTFGVFVPSVDENRLGVRILRVVFGVLEDFFEEVGIVVFEYRPIGIGRPVDPRELRGRSAALRRVPAHCRNGNVRNRSLLHHFREFFVGGNGVGVFVEKSVALFVEERFVVGVDVVARGVFKARFGEKFCRADGVARIYHCVPADGRESVFPHSFGGLVEHLFDFRRAAVVLYEVERVVHRVERTPVNRVVFGTLEVVFYAVVEHFEEVLLGARERHQIRARGGRLGAEPVCPVVVRPHDGELHFIAVGGFQKALLERLLHRALAAVPVPVVEEYGNARVRRQVDFLRNVRGIFAVEIPRERDIRQFMPFESGYCGLHKFPFRPAFAEPFFTVRIRVPVRIIDAHYVELVAVRGGFCVGFR